MSAAQLRAAFAAPDIHSFNVEERSSSGMEEVFLRARLHLWRA